MNNPLHSLIYACIANWHCINAIASHNDIRTELAIMGDSVDDQVKRVIELELERRMKELELLIRETKTIQDNLDSILKPEPVEPEDPIMSEAYKKGYNNYYSDGLNPYQEGSADYHAYRRGNLDAMNDDEGLE